MKKCKIFIDNWLTPKIEDDICKTYAFYLHSVEDSHLWR